MFPLIAFSKDNEYIKMAAKHDFPERFVHKKDEIADCCCNDCMIKMKYLGTSAISCSAFNLKLQPLPARRRSSESKFQNFLTIKFTVLNSNPFVWFNKQLGKNGLAVLSKMLLIPKPWNIISLHYNLFMIVLIASALIAETKLLLIYTWRSFYLKEVCGIARVTRTHPGSFYWKHWNQYV